MERVLLIDNDSVFVDCFASIVADGGYHVAHALTLREAPGRAARFAPDVVAINVSIRDNSATVADTLREIKRSVPDTMFVVIVGAEDVAPAEALRYGAHGSLQKPISAAEMCAVIKNVLSLREAWRQLGGQPLRAHALLRWRDTIVAFVNAPDDAKTLTEFGRTIGVSCGAFRNWCRTAGLLPRRSLLFARALRAIIRQGENPTSPQNLLNIVDLRTVAKFVRSSGGVRGRLPASVEDFLDSQQFIRHDQAITTIRDALVGVQRRCAVEAGPPQYHEAVRVQ